MTVCGNTTTNCGTRPAWDLRWLTPLRCRIVLVVVLAAGFLSHLRYLHHNCPIDLSGDEAQYWDWSRQLDLSYYSKGPLVACIIRASCAIFGQTMPAVRYPALILGVLTSIVTYLLTRRLFGSERLALGAVLLFHIVPMFIAGSVLMTIDPPMVFCWALATYFAAIAIFDHKSWAWWVVGIAIGTGFLAKYAAFLWFVGAFGFLTLHGPRRKLGPALLALLVASVFTIPVLIWNIQHDWVSLRHVATQTGATRGTLSLTRPLEMLAGQFAALGPTLAVLVIAAIIHVICGINDDNDGSSRAKLLLLAWIGLAFFAINLLASFRTKVQVNWPAPAYFTLLILTAHFIATRLRSIRTWRRWRGWFYASILIGLIFIPVAHDTSIIYPVLRPIARISNRDIGSLDPLARLRGWEELGQHVSEQLAAVGPGAFVLCDDYQQTAEMAFYVRGQPRTYCAGSYFGKRMSQYDIWPDRSLDKASPLIGRNAIYVGKGGQLPAEVLAAFGSVQKLPELPIVVDAVRIKTYKTWRCYGFLGFERPGGHSSF